MKTLKISALVLALAGLTFGAKAQTKSEDPAAATRLSIGVEGALPTGNLSNAYNWSLGGSAQVEFPLASKLALTVNAGYNNIFGKTVTVGNVSADIQDIHLLPVKAGLKYYPVGNLYVQAEGGASFLLNKDKTAYNKSAAFVYAPQVGYLFPVSAKSYIDAGVRYEGSTKFANADGSTIQFVGLRVAYAFNL
ncbi:outer membrane putative beta-barrel porin/alpha-amylase [Mucilaginibacter yixingensis]|uniref:Outer membrane putative beta-barrel porin/alpha-amylase n=1 Tax=Mucilaginibacter yixingensis TaxID=1295612 RepID=A0A2T5JE17_9SPHI|nr:transporter [Mucilaginibacter yixingensis]PTR00009.1 outer membrane putative beta-barrel porin/alpha-amylase [Mucilaginibacter yixingensis]